MNYPRRIFGLWMALTMTFIVLAVVISSLLMAQHFLRLEAEQRSAYKQLIQSEIAKDYPSISEEAYLRLGGLEVHQGDLSAIIAQKGALNLSFEEKREPGTGPVAGAPNIHWQPLDTHSDSFSLPVFFGDLSIGTLHGTVQWKNDRFSLVVRIGVLLLLLMLSWFAISHVLRQRVMGPLLQEFIQLQRSRAMGETVQMVAHDVRKPLGMAKLLADLLGRPQSPEEMQTMLAKMLPELDRAISSVNGMLTDVMEIGSETSPHKEPTYIESIVESTLAEVFTTAKDPQIEFHYDFEHQSQLDVDTSKVTRLFSNILSNAAQAMHYSGSIWFKTKEVWIDGEAFVEVCIGNSNSYIPPEDLPVLFETFFTKGKRGGTGLGLAIANKVVKAHGGQIWCESSQEKGVEFYFTLPAVEGSRRSEVVCLPSHAREYAERLQVSLNAEMGQAVSGQSEDALEQELLDLKERLGEKIRLLIIDDEALYRNAIADLVGRIEHNLSLLDIYLAKNYEEAMEKVKSVNPHVCITDIDLGRNSRDGLELVKEICDRGLKTSICIHSNRAFAGDSKRAIELGADAFLPKPMSKLHLLKILVGGAKSAIAQKALRKVPTPAPLPSAERLDGVLIENDELVRMVWSIAAKEKGKYILIFPSEKEFYEAAGTVRRDIPIYVDYFLDNNVKGADVAKELSAQGFTNLYLATGAPSSLFESLPWIKGVVGKNPPF